MKNNDGMGGTWFISVFFTIDKTPKQYKPNELKTQHVG